MRRSSQNIFPAFSPDDSRWAYNAPKLGGRPDEFISVVDGKEVPFVGFNQTKSYVFSADGRHVALTCSRASSSAGVQVIDIHVRRIARLTVVVLTLMAAACTAPAKVQAPRLAPQPGYQFVDARAQGPFEVQRWVSAAAPDVSPAGLCDCLIVVYEGPRRMVTLGTAGDLAAITIEALTGRDINGDGFPDLVVSTWSGGAHCCYTTTAYSVGRDVRKVLAVETGNCGPGTLEDLDGDGVLEFSSCDDRWADTYCDFASAPMPTVVFAYDPASRDYEVATPRFSNALQHLIDGELAETRTALAGDAGKDPGAEKCRVLRPALDLMYTGRLNEGVALIRNIYRGGDLEAFIQQVTMQMRSSPLWKAP